MAGPKVWAKFAKSKGLPQSFSKNRFDGSYNNFVKIILDRTHLKYELNKKSTHHKTLLSKRRIGSRWMYNESECLQVKSELIDLYTQNGYTLGRKNVKN